RVVERCHLSDHPADADPGEVGRRVPEGIRERGGVGREVAQRVVGCVGVDRRRLPAVAQVVAHDTAAGCAETFAELVGPREHRRRAHGEDEGSVDMAERVGAEAHAAAAFVRHVRGSTWTLYSAISTIWPSFTTYFCVHSLRNGCPVARTVPASL